MCRGKAYGTALSEPPGRFKASSRERGKRAIDPQFAMQCHDSNGKGKAGPKSGQGDRGEAPSEPSTLGRLLHTVHPTAQEPAPGRSGPEGFGEAARAWAMKAPG